MRQIGQIGLDGIEKLLPKFKLLIGVIDDAEMENRLLAAAKIIRDDAKQRAPMGPTGNLKRGIVAKTFSEKRKGQPATFVAIDYRIAPHAHLVEFGARNGHMPPTPFLRPAIDANLEAVKNTIKKGAWKVIEKEAKK